MKKSDLIKNSLDIKHEQYLEEERSLFYLLIGLIIAYTTSNLYQLGQYLQFVFFALLGLVSYIIYLVRKRLDKIRKDIMKIKIET